MPAAAFRHKARPRTALPLRITDNLNGRVLDPSKVARAITFGIGDEILKRLSDKTRIQRAEGGVTPAGLDVPHQSSGESARSPQADPNGATEAGLSPVALPSQTSHGRSGPNHSNGGAS